MRRTILTLAIANALTTALDAPQAATIQVNSLAPDNGNVGDCTLREAIEAANSNLPTDGCLAGNDAEMLVFNGNPAAIAGDIVSLQGVAGGTISLVNVSGVFATVSSNVSIAGHDVTIDGASTNTVPGIIEVSSGRALQVTDLTISGVSPPIGFGAIWARGGSRLDIRNSQFNQNSGSLGGALRLDSNVDAYVQRSTFTSNYSANGAGAIHTMNSNSLIVLDSTFSGNTSNNSGGAMSINDMAQFTLVNSTLSGNSANGNGGAIRLFSSSAEIVGSTLANNSIEAAGGGAIDVVNSTVQVSSSILSGSNRNDCFIYSGSATISDTVVSDGTCITDGVDGNVQADPLLGALANNGGPTATHRLLPGSPALDIALPMFGECPAGATDQRGQVRPSGLGCDAGAFELQVTAQSGSDFVVNASDDLGNNVCGQDLGTCTLRDALIAANAAPDVSLISFAPEVFSAPLTLSLTQGRLDIQSSVTIAGPGRDVLTIDAGGLSEVFVIDDGQPTLSDVSLSSLGLTGGFRVNAGSGILSEENLTLQSILVEGNTAQNGNPAVDINDPEQLVLSDVIIRNNQAGGLDITSSASRPMTALIDDLTISSNTSPGGRSVNSVALEQGSMLVLRDSVITGNSSPGNWSGLVVEADDAQATLERLQVTGNSGLDSSGLAIYAYYNASVSVTDVTLSQNVSQQNAGGLFVYGYAGNLTVGPSLLFNRLTVSNNSAGMRGGGVFSTVYGAVDLQFNHLTVSGNSANGDGGGFHIDVDDDYATPQISLTDVTLVNNTADADADGIGTGGGIHVDDRFVAAGSITLDRAIVAANVDQSAATQSDFAFMSGVWSVDASLSLIGDRTGSGLNEAQSPDINGNLIGDASGNGVIDPILGPLADNGGIGFTHLPLPGSPAVDIADGCSGSDQRGQPRGVDVDNLASSRECDIGAVEVQNVIPVAGLVAPVVDQNTVVGGNILNLVTDADDEDALLSLTNASADVSGLGVDLLNSDASLIINGDGSFAFDPATAFDALGGAESATVMAGYTVSDGFAAVQGPIQITVNGLNDVPITQADSLTTNEDTAVSGNVLGNDSDPDSNDVLMAALATPASNGMVTVDANGLVNYTPDPDFNGSDGFTYTVSDGTVSSDPVSVAITINAVNDAPVAQPDQYAVLTNDTLTVNATGGLLANDTDVDGGALSVVAGTFMPAGGGTLNLAADGSFSFIAPDTAGTVTFEYTVNDGQGGTSTGLLTLDVESSMLADLSITKTDGVDVTTPGALLDYTITVSNAGPMDVVNAQVEDLLPDVLENGVWMCSADANSSCVASGTNSINELVNIAGGESVTFILSATVSEDFTDGAIINMASVVPPMDTIDPNLGNNIAEDVTLSDGVFEDGFELVPTGLNFLARKATVKVSHAVLDDSPGVIARGYQPDHGLILVFARRVDGQTQLRIGRLEQEQWWLGTWVPVSSEQVMIEW